MKKFVCRGSVGLATLAASATSATLATGSTLTAATLAASTLTATALPGTTLPWAALTTSAVSECLANGVALCIIDFAVAVGVETLHELLTHVFAVAAVAVPSIAAPAAISRSHAWQRFRSFFAQQILERLDVLLIDFATMRHGIIQRRVFTLLSFTR